MLNCLVQHKYRGGAGSCDSSVCHALLTSAHRRSAPFEKIQRRDGLFGMGREEGGEIVVRI